VTRINKRRPPHEKMAVVSRCPECRGTGKVPKDIPFMANPRAPMTRPRDMGLKACLRCNGSGTIGIK
jgi:DnaJ-class molecular chaperone